MIYNDAYAEILGKKHPDAMGQPFLEVWWEIAPVLRPIVAQVSNGEPVHMDDIKLMIERDGHLEETHFAFSYTPVRSEEGGVVGFFCPCTEITGRVMNERRLLSERDDMHALYEQAPGFIAATHGSDHRFTFANASYKRLVERDHLVGQTVKETLPELVEQGIIGLLDQVYETGEPFVGTQMPMNLQSREKPETDTRYLSFVYQPIRDDSNRITGIFCEGYDATAERHAADQLSLLQSRVAHSSRVNAMGTMVTTLSHELNQPLTAISSCAAAVIRLLDPIAQHGHDVSDALNLIQGATQRAGEIIRNVREFTRRGETQKCSFELSPAIAECVQLVRAAGCPAATIETIVPEGLSLVGDRIQIQQVVVNLVRNACEAVAASDVREIVLEAKCQEDHIVVCVSDTGGGVNNEAANDLFDWGLSQKPSGTGIGLSICRTIVEAHKGKIWMERTGHFGSEFRFSVPTRQYDCD